MIRKVIGSKRIKDLVGIDKSYKHVKADNI